MPTAKIPEFTATGTFIALGGSLKATIITECVLKGNKKLDGPNYLDGVLLKVYQGVYPDTKFVDCRCSISGIYSANMYHHFTCEVTLRDESGKMIRDSVQVFIDRQTITPIKE